MAGKKKINPKQKIKKIGQNRTERVSGQSHKGVKSSEIKGDERMRYTKDN